MAVQWHHQPSRHRQNHLWNRFHSVRNTGILILYYRYPAHYISRWNFFTQSTTRKKQYRHIRKNIRATMVSRKNYLPSTFSSSDVQDCPAHIRRRRPSRRPLDREGYSDRYSRRHHHTPYRRPYRGALEYIFSAHSPRLCREARLESVGSIRMRRCSALTIWRFGQP